MTQSLATSASEAKSAAVVVPAVTWPEVIEPYSKTLFDFKMPLAVKLKLVAAISSPFPNLVS